MGGDNAPGEIVKGALAAAKELGADITLTGRREALLHCVHAEGLSEPPRNVAICHADGVVSMEDDPQRAVRDKQDSSMFLALRMLAAGEGDALVSAGNTGALLSGATLLVKRIRGIRRAALCPFLPTAKGRALLIDCGANAECTPEYLLQFAFMGSFYATAQTGIVSPRVGLLNIGSEPTKGTALQKEAYALLQKALGEGLLNFTGNVEGRGVPLGEADVVVADGYSGNILLKAMEGTGIMFAGMLKKMFLSGVSSKFAALLLQKPIGELKKTMDYTETGGTPLLGLQKPVIKAHGSSNAKALKNAVRQAMLFHGSGVIGKIEENMSKMKMEVAVNDGV
jgi:glycerol-3-phosphate acyltransferase PlsX